MAYKNKRNDSSAVKHCLSQEDSGQSQKNDGPDQQHHRETLPDTDLICFSDDNTSKATSFENPSPSAVESSTTGTTGSSSCSGSKPGSGEKQVSGGEPKPCTSSSGERYGYAEKTSGTRGDNMRSESSGPSSWYRDTPTWTPRYRDTPTWTPRKASECGVVLGPLQYTADHTVLVNVHDFSRNQTLKSLAGRPQWDGLHVKMPHAQESIIMKSTFLTNLTQSAPEKQARWSVISKHLKKLLSGSPTGADVEKAIKSYNPKYEPSWSFAGLQNYVQTVPRQESLFSIVIPTMAELALKLPEYVPKAVPLLKQGKTHSITLSQLQIAALLANAFFCTFPHRNSTNKNAEYANYPTINFSSLFGNSSKTTVEKLRAILHYFHTVTACRPSGLVTFERRCIPGSRLPNWRERTEPLGNVRVTAEGSIEEQGKGMLQVDFACNLVGGGVLGSGLVQEEILFLMNPELIVARLFTEKLSDNECLKITGSQQYSNYSGYSRTFEWSGSYEDDLTGEKDEWKRIQRQIVAIDALNFKHPREQYQRSKIIRELNKAFVGFSEEGRFPHELPTIATGNWGCGAFHGDPILKALIQMMAAAVVKRDLMFFTFRDINLEKKVWKIYTVLKNSQVTVRDIYAMLDIFCQSSGPSMDLYHFILANTNSSSSL